MSEMNYDSQRAFIAANREKVRPHMESSSAAGAFARAYDLVRGIEDWLDAECARCGADAAVIAYANVSAHLLAHAIAGLHANGQPGAHDAFLETVLSLVPAKLAAVHAFPKTKERT
jgi:hypothetical protein